MLQKLRQLQDGEKTAIKLNAGRYKKEVKVERYKNRFVLRFGFSRKLIDEVKSMEGRKWHGFDTADHPRGKWWSIPITERNLFTLAYLMGLDPYERYNCPLEDVEIAVRSLKGVPTELYEHQKTFVKHILTRRHCIIAGEMGTGKTLGAGVAVELFQEMIDLELHPGNFWFIAPKSALRAVELDFAKWDIKVKPTFMTYDHMRKMIENWVPGTPAPRVLIDDESSKLKNPKAKRTIANQILADGIRSDYGYNSLIVEMSGSPAPKSPLDWWAQCEIARPGFLKEGSLYAADHRLSVIVSAQGLDGTAFPKRLAWKDRAGICENCGKSKEDLCHDFEFTVDPCVYQEAENEVAKLYRRMNGLVLVMLKKDCLDLPEKQYEMIYVEPTKETKRFARLVQKRETTAIGALTALRTLSDGFQYVQEQCGEKKCPTCLGESTINEWFDPEEPEATVNPHDRALAEFGVDRTIKDYNYEDCDEYYIEGEYYTLAEARPILEERAKEIAERFEQKKITCPHCAGNKVIPEYTREPKRIDCPKDKVVLDELDNHEEIGRLIIYAGFFGSVDRVVDICLDRKWVVIRVDGRGWHVFHPEGGTFGGNPLILFQELLKEYPRVVFIGQPDAAGMGITLTASPTILYYSNSFNAEGRIQSEDRIHRVGMDVNRGATIKDIIHLPTDEYVLNNLKAKRKLQDITLGEIVRYVEEGTNTDRE